MLKSFTVLISTLGLSLSGSWLAWGQSVSCSGHLRFRITLAKEIAPKATVGRLLVLMSDSPQERQTLSPHFGSEQGWTAALEVTHFAPEETIEFNPDLKSYPRPFSQAKPGTYQFMALLDTDHSYAYNGQNEGDLYGPVVKAVNIDPSNTRPVELILNQRTEAKLKVADTESTKLVEFQSPLLSAFWGRPIQMRAGIVLPPNYGKNQQQVYAAVYEVHGFGSNHTTAWRQGEELIKRMREGKQMEAVYVFLDGSLPTGHHEFADSVNNGPWGKALTKEFIPFLERRFRLIKKPYARFLTGHSSGGWSTLWLQVTYPDFFGGTWSTAPDPVDLRSFTGIDVTPGSSDNVYHTRDGRPRNLVRTNGETVEQFVRLEEVLGEYGGQFASFEWVWSPKGQDGRPMKLFNRESGELDPEVEKAWQKYDIRLILEKNWATLGPKLRGKIHVICGAEDTYHLEEAAMLLCDFFKRKRSDAVCEIVPGRNHGNLFKSFTSYPDGLEARISKEMQIKLEAGRKAAAKPKSPSSHAVFH